MWCGLHPGCQEPPVDGDCDSRNDKSTSDPVYLFSGEYYLEVEDLRIPGRGFDFVLTRTYRSKTGRLHNPLGNSVNRMGDKWDWSYNIYLQEAGPHLIFCDGHGRINWFQVQPDGTWAHPGYFRVIEQEPDESYTMTHADGTVWRFEQDPFSDDILIMEMIDRNGNTMQFNNVTNGIQRMWLDHIIDTLGRVIYFSYGGGAGRSRGVVSWP